MQWDKATHGHRDKILEILQSDELLKVRTAELKHRIREERRALEAGNVRRRAEADRDEDDAERLIKARIANAVKFHNGELSETALQALRHKDQGRIKHTLIAAYNLLRQKIADGEDCGGPQRVPSQQSSMCGSGCTPTYAAPEQLSNSIKDARCDTFSLGMVYAESFCAFTSGAERGEVLHRPNQFTKVGNKTVLRAGGALWGLMGWQSMPALTSPEHAEAMRVLEKCCKLGSNAQFSDDLKLLRGMLAERVEDRPHARDIVEMHFLKTSATEVESLQTQIRKLNQELDLAHKKIEEQKGTILKLGKQNSNLKLELAGSHQKGQLRAPVEDECEPLRFPS